MYVSCISIFILPDKKLNYPTSQFSTGHQKPIFFYSCWLFFFFKSNVERMCRTVEDQFNEIKAKDDQQTQLIHDLNMQKARLQTQNGKEGLGSRSYRPWVGNGQQHTCISLVGELSHQLEEKECLISQLTKGKQALTQQLEELKRQLEEETKVRMPLSEKSESDPEKLRKLVGGRPAARNPMLLLSAVWEGRNLFFEVTGLWHWISFLRARMLHPPGSSVPHRVV